MFTEARGPADDGAQQNDSPTLRNEVSYTLHPSDAGKMSGDLNLVPSVVKGQQETGGGLEETKSNQSQTVERGMEGGGRDGGRDGGIKMERRMEKVMERGVEG